MNEEDKPRESDSQKDAAWLELLKLQTIPDMKSKYDNLLSKEMKTSNISNKDREELEEMGDLAFQWGKLGAEEASEFLVYLMQQKLCLSSSLHGFQVLAQQTSINRQILTEDKKGNIAQDIFRRKGNKE